MDTLFDFERFPRIETPRLVLRELRREDAEAVFRIFSDPEVVKYSDMDMFTKYIQLTFLALEPMTDKMFCGRWLKRSKHT